MYNCDITDAKTVLLSLERIMRVPEIHSSVRHRGYAVFVERNATGRTFAKDMCIHQLFESRAEETPEATAVVCGELRITYRELNELSNQLAHHLRELGVKTNEPIAIC